MFWQNELLQKLKLKVTKVPNFTYIWFTSDATPNPEPKKFLLPYRLLHQKRDSSKSWPFYDHFWPFFCQLQKYISQKWGSDEHFEVPNLPKS